MYKIEEIIEALLYFANSREITTKIVKACYLLESEYFDKTGQRLTNVEYKYYIYGPFSESITSSMKNDSNIFYSQQTSMDGNDYGLFTLKKTSALSRIDPFTLSLIERWAKIAQQSTLEEMLNLAYKDKNFKKAKQGEIIKFESSFLKKKEIAKKRIKEKFSNHKFSKEEIEELSKIEDEQLLEYTRNLLRESD